MNGETGGRPIGRRESLQRLAALALSTSFLSAFRRVGESAAPKWDDRFEVLVDLEIAAQQGYRYHRPYVAVWIEDAAGKPVRTLTLWVNTSGRGPRYIRELRRWWTAERDSDAGETDLISSVSSATRMPGRYSMVWDGRDDRGRPVPQGKYRVYIEAAREHGGYQLLQQELSVGTSPVSFDLSGNEEIGSARVEYRRRK